MSDILKEDLERSNSNNRKKMELLNQDPLRLKSDLFTQLSQTTSFIKRQALIIKYDDILRKQEEM